MSTDVSSNPANQKYRKRKRSVLQKARKFAKKGCYGRGNELDSDTYGYFVKIFEANRDGFPSDEDKSIFVNNFFDEINDKEIYYSCNQLGCRVIETLLPFTDGPVLDRLIIKFGDDLRPLCSDRFASHVIESLIKQSCKKSFITGEKDVKTEFQQNCKNFVLKVSKFLLNNLEDYIGDTYANHTMRTCLECMARVLTDKQVLKSDERIKKDRTLIIPSEYEDVIKEYGERILAWPQFGELCNNDLTSGFLQSLLKSLKQVDMKLLNKYLTKLLNENFINEQETVDYNLLPPVFLSTPLVRLLETSIQVARKKNFTQIYLKCFLNRLPKLATTQPTTFAVQKLIACCKEKTEIEAIFVELEDSFKQIIDAGHTGVLLALGQSCKKFVTKQAPFVQSLMKSLDCLEPEDRQNNFIIGLVTFRQYDTIQEAFDLSKAKLNLHGTLILQLLLEFTKPIKIVNGLLNMESKTLKDLFCNMMGCHITESFVNSSSVGEKSRYKLMKKLQGHYQELASEKYGSRAFEDLWNAANLKTKLQIMDELADKDGSWSNTQCGRIIAYKVNLVLYKRSKQMWQNSLNVGDKAEKLFEDIIN